MKKNAGKMKLAMAQYRELESFAQFDSDLDHDTRKTIERGKRTSEMLKQANGSPLPVGLQVASIYAVNNSFIDHVGVVAVSAWEKGMHEYMLLSEKDLMSDLNKDWSEDLETKLKGAITAYNEAHHPHA
jgi:F-type H+-transporting ATPase subunit alpha